MTVTLTNNGGELRDDDPVPAEAGLSGLMQGGGDAVPTVKV